MITAQQARLISMRSKPVPPDQLLEIELQIHKAIMGGFLFCNYTGLLTRETIDALEKTGYDFKHIGRVGNQEDDILYKISW